MITEEDIKKEVVKLNEASKRLDRNYEYKKGKDGMWGLFDVHGDTYKPVYAAGNEAGFFAYVSLLKNLYLGNKMG